MTCERPAQFAARGNAEKRRPGARRGRACVRAVTRGMSGGPLLDLRRGVVGVLHGKGCESSIFTGLDAVDAYLAQQRSAANGAG